MRYTAFKCAFCKKKAKQPSGAVNRALKIGAPLFCDRTCSGLGRRNNKPLSQRKEEKRLYDMQYRALNRERLRKEKHEYFLRSYDPVKAAVERKKSMHLHVAYCRRPEYRAKKRAYDKQYRAKQQFGDFAEAALILREIEGEVDSRMSRYEVYQANGTLNKKLQRRRDYERLNCN